MHDAEEPKKSTTWAASQTVCKGFLPEVALPSPMPPEPVAIADMANMFGVTHRTLHFYEEKAIISSRRAGLMRIYSHRDVHRMAVINFCREIGIPVASIQDIMQKLADAPSQEAADTIFQEVLAARKAELASEISTVRRQIQQISDVLLTDAAAADTSVSTCDQIEQEDVQLNELEQQCLELMAEGYAPIRLARMLDVSANELQKLETGIMDKLSANNRFQAVAKGFMLGVITNHAQQPARS
ncbi:MerR family transcriptional regulator [Agrobacterium rubi]|uniref:MerR family transcriptional regulator n=1 Tax=Agrobacterium rubi TaxID=28099 RepID=A0AAE7UP04_9HYPH|nr:MerR family transcriptional regulator [Agrobacterium rubi]NTF02697.1 MerR family transcriptional regulator [Agrobacterium rubi]NTF36941.1 MerR family transcriptional regulator [Agrobacterium rubi]OCJ55459.1 LuxR family transcriptional regulator [Agrobacterium rubi]QTG01523.1 MerR family transcriptional regulator [Agrobacterium rubi]